MEQNLISSKLDFVNSNIVMLFWILKRMEIEESGGCLVRRVFIIVSNTHAGHIIKIFEFFLQSLSKKWKKSTLNINCDEDDVCPLQGMCEYNPEPPEISKRTRDYSDIAKNCYICIISIMKWITFLNQYFTTSNLLAL